MPSEAQPGQAHLAGVGVGVGDLDRSIAWYASLLRLDEQARFRFDAAGLEIAMLAGAGFHLELMAPAAGAEGQDRRLPPRHVRPGQLAHMVLSVEDLAAFERTAEALAVPVLWRSTAQMPARFLFVADPDGNLIQLIER